MLVKENLDPLCVMVTRPKPQGELLCEKILACGGYPIHFPTIEIAPPRDISLPQQQLSELNQYDWAIFISPSAVYYSIKMLGLTTRVKIAAIGASTANILQKEGLPVSVYPTTEWNSEGLLALPEFQTVRDQKIAIVQGEGGRNVLADELVARGAEVVPITVYQRRLPIIDTEECLDLLRRNVIDMIICTSNEGMQNLKILLNSSWSFLQNVPLLVISQRMVIRAKELGFKHIKMAINASDNAILEALEQGK